MQINCNNSIGFKGLWAPVKKITRETGTYNINKSISSMYETVYHPWVDEAKDVIEKTINEYFYGRSFSLMDKQEGQHKADIYKMNFIRVGEPIKREDTQKYLDEGYTENFIKYVPDVADLYDAYSNDSYGIFDVYTYNRDMVIDFVKRKFNVKV